jgi:predicted component of type VI protein secretion system
MESRGNYRLTVRQGPVPGKVFELVKDVVTVGRDVSNDITINDAEVSRNHARLSAQSGGYLMEDLASTNGTFVNGQRLIGPKLLNPGDVVGLGETVVLEFGVMADAAGATVIASAPMAPRPAAAPPPPPPAEHATTPPRPPEPEPMPPPTMAEPVYAEPPPQPMAPPPPPSAPLPQKKDNRTLMYVGGGCGCLTLCACLGGLAYWAFTSGMLSSFGF